MASGNVAAKKRHKHNMIYGLALVVVIIALVAISALKPSGIVNIGTSGSNLTISSKPVIIEAAGSEYAIYLASAPSNDHVSLYIDSMPALVKPAILVSLNLGNVTKVNTYGNFTTMEVRLDAIGNASATITIKPVSPSLQIAPDTSSIKFITWNLNNSNNGIKITTNIINATNSTAKINTTTKITTTTTSVTTIPQLNITAQNITSLLNKNIYYGLVLNYTALYDNTTKCTSTLYNSTYLSTYGSLPPASYSYQNMSSFIPYGMIIKRINEGSGVYTVNFVELTRNQAFNNTNALSIVLNANKYVIISSTLGGVYQGDNYTTLLKGYREAEVIGGPCGVYAAH
ncbi:MAG: hypothetical protein ACP5MX_01950 [Candidatus Micrarchaeia archaeon]